MHKCIEARCTFDNLIMGNSIQNKLRDFTGSMLLVAYTNQRTAAIPNSWAPYLDGLRSGHFVRVEIPIISKYDVRSAAQLVHARILQRPYKNQPNVFARGQWYDQTFYVGAAPTGRESGLMDII